MVSELKNHIESSVQHEQTKRKMQISLLMSQINPHFVYNTLNTIIYLCHAGRNKEAAEMTQTLIAILQDTIKTGEGEEFARLDEEWKMVEKYAVIQMTRYPGKFRLEWEVEPELQHERIPRMLLQPLVENALLHGIFPDRRDRQGLITIRAGREKEMLVLEVMDNGIGFREGEGEPAAVGPDRKEPGRTRGIGLANIRERMKYHYGESGEVSISSSAGNGATVTVRLPRQTYVPQMTSGY